MSNARFASITADILARKGEAKPWIAQMQSQETAAAPPLVVRTEPMTLSGTVPPIPPAKDRSCSVRMSAHDFQRLGILAVKASVTRQQLLKDALAQFLAERSRMLSCACLASGRADGCEKGCG